MIPFEKIDKELERLGKTRAWLAEVTRRSPDSIRAALAPNAALKSRSSLLQKALTDALQREEADKDMMVQPIPPGYRNVFMDDAQLDRADRASREIGCPSLAEFCRDAILFRANEILEGKVDPVPSKISLSMVADGETPEHLKALPSKPVNYRDVKGK